MHFLKLVILLVALFPLSSGAGEIDGFWKHAKEPGWIEIRLEEGVWNGKVVRNDVYPERVGRVLLKDLEADQKKAGLWRGQVYAERFEEYKDAEVRLLDDDRLEVKVKVGFISRKVEWVRATRESALVQPDS